MLFLSPFGRRLQEEEEKELQQRERGDRGDRDGRVLEEVFNSAGRQRCLRGLNLS